MKKVLFVVGSMLLLAGCGGEKEEAKPTALPALEYKMGSNDWTILDTFKASPDVKEAYAFAVEHPEVLDYMPCYCGCYEDDGHTSNTDCFVDSVNDDKAVLDSMGLG